MYGFDQNRIWLAIVMLASNLTAWLQMLTLAGTEARTWEPNACGCACFPSPAASPAAPAKHVYDCPRTHPGHT